jgi:amino acid transporter
VVAPRNPLLGRRRRLRLPAGRPVRQGPRRAGRRGHRGAGVRRGRHGVWRRRGISAIPFTIEAFTSGHLGNALVFTVALFTGFEAIAIYREETINPEKTIPRAITLTVLCVGAFYILTSWAAITGLGNTNAVSAATNDLAGSFFTVATTYLGTVFVDLTSVLLLTSVFAAHLAIQNVATRYVYSLSKDGILPRA